MLPVDTFLRSVRDAFHRPDDVSVWGWAAVAGVCLSSVVAFTMVGRYLRRQAQKAVFARFLSERKVSPKQVVLMNRLSDRAKVAAFDVATRIDVFERATAMELARFSPSVLDGSTGVFGDVAALRRALGFEGIAGHFAMLTTRELSAGQVVEIAGVAATVTEVTEAYFAAVAPAAATLPIGQEGSQVRVTLTRDQEARYETRCTLLARQAGDETQRLVFAHDEHPNRVQLRSAVRVTVRGPVRVNQMPGHVGASRAPAVQQGGATQQQDDGPVTHEDETELGMGALLDISVGGAALDTTVHVPVGSLVRLTFVIDGATYRDLLAFVLECQVRARGAHHMRVQFRNLAQADEQRLAASVARYSAHPFTDPTQTTKSDGHADDES